jgi:hypothetical protein
LVSDIPSGDRTIVNLFYSVVDRRLSVSDEDKSCWDQDQQDEKTRTKQMTFPELLSFLCGRSEEDVNIIGTSEERCRVGDNFGNFEKLGTSFGASEPLLTRTGSDPDHAQKTGLDPSTQMIRLVYQDPEQSDPNPGTEVPEQQRVLYSHLSFSELLELLENPELIRSPGSVS